MVERYVFDCLRGAVDGSAAGSRSRSMTRLQGSEDSGRVAKGSASQRIHDGKEREAMKVSVVGADSADPVLAHQHCGMQVVNQVRADVRQLRQGLPQDRRVTLRRAQQLEPRRRRSFSYGKPSIKYSYLSSTVCSQPASCSPIPCGHTGDRGHDGFEITDRGHPVIGDPSARIATER